MNESNQIPEQSSDQSSDQNSVQDSGAHGNQSQNRPKITTLEQNVDLIEFEGRRIFLIGTAHVSRTSADLVEKVIREQQPDSICIELCDARYQSITNPDRWAHTDIYEVIRSGRTYVLTAQIALATFQKKIAEQLGIRPGEEMRRAIELAEEYKTEIGLIDRDVRTTLKRAWGKAGLWSLAKIIASLVASLFAQQKLSEDEIEKLKEGDALTAVMSEFADFLPGVKDALIDERDKYMSFKLLHVPGNTLVAIVGAGHVPGMKQVIGTPIDIEALEEIPPTRKLFKYLAWGCPIVFVLLIILSFVFSGAKASMDMVLAWILATGLLSALGAAIALAHPLTILAAFLAAPITTLNPMIAAGWVCGLVEAMLKKPKVKDLQTIADDVMTLKGIWKNGVSRILLVVAFANLGSAAGSFVGAGAIVWILNQIGTK